MAKKPASQRQRTIYLPEAVDKKIRIRAAQLDTTVSVVIAQALRAYFAAETNRVKKDATTPSRVRRRR